MRSPSKNAPPDHTRARRQRTSALTHPPRSLAPVVNHCKADFGNATFDLSPLAIQNGFLCVRPARARAPHSRRVTHRPSFPPRSYSVQDASNNYDSANYTYYINVCVGARAATAPPRATRRSPPPPPPAPHPAGARMSTPSGCRAATMARAT